LKIKCKIKFNLSSEDSLARKKSGRFVSYNTGMNITFADRIIAFNNKQLDFQGTFARW